MKLWLHFNVVIHLFDAGRCLGDVGGFGLLIPAVDEATQLHMTLKVVTFTSGYLYIASSLNALFTREVVARSSMDSPVLRLYGPGQGTQNVLVYGVGSQSKVGAKLEQG